MEEFHLEEPRCDAKLPELDAGTTHVNHLAAARALLGIGG